MLCVLPETVAQVVLNWQVCYHGGGNHFSDSFISAFFDIPQPPEHITVVLLVYCLKRWSIIMMNNALVVKGNCPQCLHIASKRAFFALGRFGVFQCEDLALVS